jgi:hypothetical protein
VKLGRDGVMGWGGVFGVYPGIWGGVASVLGLDYPVKGAGGGCHGFFWSFGWKGLDFGQRLLAASIQVLPDRPYRRLSRQIATARPPPPSLPARTWKSSLVSDPSVHHSCPMTVSEIRGGWC